MLVKLRHDDAFTISKVGQTWHLLRLVAINQAHAFIDISKEQMIIDHHCLRGCELGVNNADLPFIKAKNFGASKEINALGSALYLPNIIKQTLINRDQFFQGNRA